MGRKRRRGDERVRKRDVLRLQLLNPPVLSRIDTESVYAYLLPVSARCPLFY